MSLIAMYSPGIHEVLLVLFLALLFFGKRLPEMARSLGRGFREFKGGLKEGHDEQPPGELPEGQGNGGQRGETDPD